MVEQLQHFKIFMVVDLKRAFKRWQKLLYLFCS